ncbi:MAG: YggT family protein [Propionibacteriaceae bacterium]|nr:YggT family protein [Propionibacteriaceae bacterium]
MAATGQVLSWVCQIFIFLLIVRALVSWITVLAPGFRPRGIVLLLLEGVYTVTDPPLKLLRRWIRPIRVGMMSLDLAFILLWILVMVLQQVILVIFRP